jgi:hypothetical protein
MRDWTVIDPDDVVTVSWMEHGEHDEHDPGNFL